MLKQIKKVCVLEFSLNYETFTFLSHFSHFVNLQICNKLVLSLHLKSFFKCFVSMVTPNTNLKGVGCPAPRRATKLTGDISHSLNTHIQEEKKWNQAKQVKAPVLVDSIHFKTSLIVCHKSLVHSSNLSIDILHSGHFDLSYHEKQ